MNKYLYKIISFCALASLVCSCDLRMSVEVDGSQLEAEPYLVVHSFISPLDSLITVRVRETSPKAGKNASSLKIEDVEVYLSNGTDTVKLEYYTDSLIYAYYEVHAIQAEKFPIIAGQSYFLKVETPDGRIATASCQVPEYAPDFTIELFQFTEGEYYSPHYESYGAKVTWKDNDPKPNFYRYVQQWNEIKEDREEFLNMWEDESYERPPFYDDQHGQGATFKVENHAYSIYDHSDDEGFPELEEINLEFYVLNTDLNYYEYHKRLYETGKEESFFDRFREPSQIYSNIEGGVGLFAAYNGSVKKFKLVKGVDF
jgi:hypothetical protein